MPNDSDRGYLASVWSAFLDKGEKDRSAGSQNYTKRSEGKQPRPDTVRVHVTNQGWPADDSRHQRHEAQYWVASIFISLLAFAAAGGAAFFAGGAYFAAKEQVVQAKRQADAADTALKEGNRPLIATSGVKWSAPLVKDTDNGVRILFANIGKSPTLFSAAGIAKRIDADVGNVDYDTIDVGENPFCDIIKYFRDPTNTAYPSLNLANLNTGEKIDKSLVNDLMDKAKKVTVVVQGCLFYKDIDGIRVTGYCYIVAQGQKLADPSNTPICAKGNFNH